MVRPDTKPRGGRGAGAGAGALRRRADRDGDAKMADITVKGASSSKIGKKPPTGPADRRSARNPAGTRKDLTSAGARRDLLRKAAASGDVSMRETKAPRLVELNVEGWKSSKAASNPDGGYKSLIQWLEKKAGMRLGRRDTRIKKDRLDADTVVISVPVVDAKAYERMDGYEWAGAKLSIKRVGGAGQDSNQPSSGAEETKAMLRGVLERRWNPETKFLDLSALGTDAELQATGIFGTSSTTAKFFPALMKVLDLSFNSTKERDEAIEAVSLANNDLEDLKIVSPLSQSLPNLINLDLSNNKIATLASLKSWQHRFKKLQHLIVSGNPIEQNEPNAAPELIRWYKNLRLLNNVQVRTDEDIKNQNNVTNIPFPIRTPHFQDENGIVEGFIRNWFAGFDTDRPALARMYYDEHSEFSYALNTHAPRDPLDTEKTQSQEWASWIQGSRNLKRLTQLPARQKRLLRGTQATIDAFAGLPKTQHPDLATEPQKWMIEAHLQPGIPDPINNTPGGVDGFFMSIHGEFTEPESGKKRSCDHAIYIGPGGSTGVRVVSHMITVRAYGGTQAFQATAGPQTPPQPAADAATTDGLPQLPEGVTIEVAEQMCAELTKQTGMTTMFSHECLREAAWNFENALAMFQRVKATLPATAYINGAPLI
ncbi:Putative TAP (TAP-C) domain, UBA-like superfamily, nuclear transport factor 2 [Septoria linicola]|uniref:mRNA export factor MEX67 n=1 Tax=Septoria linicola TaxID=215465 RepID=A0A9Q9EKI4_9PEZI|nr:Putative TAP (TAP-C) domain, UBA-like superfamily, nuclear transport factor 2 [Septoria linicola]